MPDVSTILARLRADWTEEIGGQFLVTVDRAVSAVEEAYRAGEDARAAEIVGALRGMAADGTGSPQNAWAAGFAAEVVAHRFPGYPRQGITFQYRRKV